MAIFQGLLALITRSLGSILSALFGWAVVALFGPTSSREKVWLSALVGAAAAWPILVLGAIWPRVAAMLLTFAPLPSWIPSSLIRAVWVTLAVIVPFALGTAVAARSRGPAVPIPGTRRMASSAGSPDSAARRAPVHESKIVRLFRGIPITLAIAASFLIVFITVPLQRLRSMIRRQVDIDVPLVTDAQGYPLVAEEIAATLSRHGVKVAPTTPDWTVTAPSRILSRLGGPSFDAYVPRRFTQFEGPRLEADALPEWALAPRIRAGDGVGARAARGSPHGCSGLSNLRSRRPGYRAPDPTGVGGLWGESVGACGGEGSREPPGRDRARDSRAARRL